MCSYYVKHKKMANNMGTFTTHIWHRVKIYHFGILSIHLSDCRGLFAYVLSFPYGQTALVTQLQLGRSQLRLYFLDR